MSSLLQHHGCTTKHRPGYVELLMYRKERVLEKQLSCNECGHLWTKGDVNCQGCGRFVLFVREYPQFGDYKDALDIVEMEHAIKHPNYQNCKCQNDVCTVSNRWGDKDSEPVTLTRPNGTETIVSKLYRIWRKPCGMFGCWVVFRYNGEEHVPDLSVPIGVYKLPRDAEPLTDDEAAAYWFA